MSPTKKNGQENHEEGFNISFFKESSKLLQKMENLLSGPSISNAGCMAHDFHPNESSKLQ